MAEDVQGADVNLIRWNENNTARNNYGAGILKTLPGDVLSALTLPPLAIAGSMAMAESFRREVTRERVGGLVRRAIHEVTEPARLYLEGVSETYRFYYDAGKRGWNLIEFQEAPEESLPHDIQTEVESTAPEGSGETWEGFVDQMAEHVKAGEDTARRLALDDTKNAELLPGDIGVTPKQVESGEEAREKLGSTLGLRGT